jgi:hypothetical protein
MPGVFIPETCKKVTYKMTQSSTAAPAIGYTLGNTFGQALATAPTLARTSAGIYTITKTAYWVANKTVVRVTSNNSAGRVCQVVYTSADVITLNWFDVATPSAADSGDFDITIEVYE